MLDGTFGYDRTGTTTQKLRNAKDPKGFYAPVGSDDKYIALSGELSCQPCHKKHCAFAEEENGCTFLPSVDDVLEAVKKLL